MALSQITSNPDWLIARPPWVKLVNFFFFSSKAASDKGEQIHHTHHTNQTQDDVYDHFFQIGRRPTVVSYPHHNNGEEAL
jgi:hypothetical protein